MFWKVVVEFSKTIVSYSQSGKNLWKIRVKKLIFSEFAGFQHTRKMFQSQIQNSHRQSRNRRMNAFIIVNINPACKRYLKDKSMLVHSKKAFLLPSVWPGTEYIWAFIWKKAYLFALKATRTFPIPTQAE